MKWPLIIWAGAGLAAFVCLVALAVVDRLQHRRERKAAQSFYEAAGVSPHPRHPSDRGGPPSPSAPVGHPTPIFWCPALGRYVGTTCQHPGHHDVAVDDLLSLEDLDPSELDSSLR